jgi:hypothetical protein
MIVKVVVVGQRALVSGPPGSSLAAFEASATRVRCRFTEPPDAEGRLVGYFHADDRVLGEAESEEYKGKTRLAEVFEIGDRVYPREAW